MLAAFCLRLALGLLASLLLLSPKQLQPRFFRTHFLTALGLLVVATVSGWDEGGEVRYALAGGAVLSLLGALAWTLESAQGGRLLIVLTVAVLLLAVACADRRDAGPTIETGGRAEDSRTGVPPVL